MLDAIKTGYRHIDTAQSYFNEEEVGNTMSKCKLPRRELFITPKVWIDNYRYEKTKEPLKKSPSLAALLPNGTFPDTFE